MRVALADLRLEHLFVVHPGDLSFPLDEKVTAVALSELEEHLAGKKEGAAKPP